MGVEEVEGAEGIDDLLVGQAYTDHALVLRHVGEVIQGGPVCILVSQVGIAFYDEERVGIVGIGHRVEQGGQGGVVVVTGFDAMPPFDFPAQRHVGGPQVFGAALVDVELAALVCQFFVLVVETDVGHEAEVAEVERELQRGFLDVVGLLVAITVGVEQGVEALVVGRVGRVG